MFKGCCIVLVILAVNAFSQWYAKGKSYEKCMNTSDGFLVCRENYVNDFCYGKERVWTDDNNRILVSVRNLNAKCEYNGWARFRLADGKWVWQCYRNNRAMQDENCKGYRKR